MEITATNPPPASTGQGSLRTLLREATQAQHERLNRHALLAGLPQPGYTLANYRLLLQTFYRLYRGLEQRLAEFAAGPVAGFDYAARAKLPWLEADLRHFGIDPAGLESAAAPVSVPAISGLGDYVGVLYVIEGSTLGGQMIAKCLRQHLGLTPSGGARFYSGYGEAGASMWRGYLAFAESVAADAEQAGAARWPPTALSHCSNSSSIEPFCTVRWTGGAAMVSFSPEQLEQALQKCAAEPIHQIGQIQPHGALLVVTADAGAQVVQASANLSRFLPCSAEQALGRPFADLCGGKAAEQLQALAEIARSRNSASGKLAVAIGGALAELQAHVYLCNGGIAVELMADQAENPEARLAELLLQMQDALLQIDTDREYLHYFDQVAILVRTLCGYDSVMVYRFDSEWNGEVVSQSRIETAPSYLGLHFPASDIPAQARRLFALNPVRVVADIEAEPVPVLPALNPLAGEPLDMTYSALRCLSPIHIQYLRNIGVRASMVVSLLQNGRLWGLIACHHHGPKPVSISEREAVTFISRMTSAKLAAIEAVEQHNHVTSANHLIGELLNYIFTSQEETILQRLLPELMRLLHADAVIALVEGKRHRHGPTPTVVQLDELLPWLSGQASTTSFSCDHLAKHFPKAAAYPDTAAGVLCTPLSADLRNGIVWFRAEKPRTVHWAGHAEKGLVEDEAGGYRLTPRESFQVWSELWRGRSAPWTIVELGVANMLAVTLPEGLAQKSRLDQALKQQSALDAELRIAATAFESQEGIVVLDSARNILRVNRAFCRITGHSAEFAVGKIRAS
ncbi:GAF domain-containing protein [Methylomonas koyamae]|uniref:GAF domain-containing protein n=1 Tax=Methylomonas koyamae TaxID=702114 RepID=UPI000B10677A|nr:GAF domain-containing protein [Methylomonas koyamae]